MSLPPIAIDILIFVVFFVLNIVVGFRYRGKKQSFREYAIGDKKFSTATLTATIVATWMSGSAFFMDLEETYSHGLYYIIAVIVGVTVGLLLTGCVVGPRMGKFMNSVSAPELLGKLYGKAAQVIAGLSCVISASGYIAIQLQVIARILTALFNYEGPEIVIISAIVITLYSVSGGVKAVTFTDVLQFLTFGTLLPILALTIWNNLQDHSVIVQMLHNNPLFSFKKVIGWSPEFMGTLILMSYLMTPGLPPQLFQRMVMARDTAQIRRSMTYAAAICLAITLCSMWIAILILADQPGLAPSKVVKYLVDAHVYTGLKGFLGIGVIALAMSTADSVLNSCAVIIANDILPPLGLQKTSSLSTAKWSTLLLSMLAMIIALGAQDLLQILLGSANFYTPIVVVPMLLSIFGFQTSKKIVLIAMGAGATVTAACLFYFKNVNSFFPGMLANLITMLGAHYLLKEKDGWGHNPIRDKDVELVLRLSQPSWKVWLTQKQKFSLSAYLARTLPAEDYFYSLFGFYVFTATYASFYFLPQEITKQFPNLYSAIQYSVLLLLTTFLAFPIWPSVMKAKRLLAWLWPLCAFYALFLVGGTLVVLSGFATEQILIFMLNFVMAVLLLHWPIVLAMAGGSIVLIALAFSQYTNLANAPGDLDMLQFRIAYGLLLSSSFLMALFKHKQTHDLLARHNKELSSERKITQQELVKALGHKSRFFSEITTAGTNVLEAVSKRVANFSQQALTAATPQELTKARHALEDAHQAIKDTMTYLQNVVYRVQGHLRLEEVCYIATEQLLARAIEVFRAQHTQQQLRPRINDMAGIKFVQCDPLKIQQLLVNAWLYAQQHGDPKKPVFLGIQKTTLGYLIPSVKGYIKEVPALCITVGRSRDLPKPKPLYLGAKGPGNFQIPETVSDLIILDNQRIVDAHYGSVELRHKDGDVQTQVYVIPIHLREVRPSMMDLPQMDVGYMIPDDKAVRPEETALLKKLQEKTPVDMELAAKAIWYIKKYHGLAKRKTGEFFYLHPIAATDIIVNYTEDQETIFATLLHDSVEDTPLTLSEIGVVFGPEVAAIVNKVTHLDGQFHRIKMNTQENVRQLLKEADMRVLQVKLADRLHNMRTIRGHVPDKQKKIAEETLHFFMPIAMHLGLKQIEEELQVLIAAVMQK